MNLDFCTEGQRQSIRCVRGPLLISAGAGSGKTFTLTQRIAYALLPESGPAAASIDDIMAITFTEKAAAEIKARVKRTLRAEGLFEEALKVDGAWISTIHGACSRILHTHALELQLDPSFGMLSDAEREDLLSASIDEALGAENDIVDSLLYPDLFREYPARTQGFNAVSVSSMIYALLNKAASVRGGFDGFDLGPKPVAVSSLVRLLLMAFEELQALLDKAGASATAQKARVQVDEARALIRSFLSEAHDSADDDALYNFACLLDQCPFVPASFGNASVKEGIKQFQARFAYLCRETQLNQAWPLIPQLMSLARKVSACYERKKQALCKLDNDDLLVKTLDALSTNPEIAREYADRFKLVMVDEFQDTSQVQIDLISYLAGTNSERLCTVGDTQQSIYRFRGADVNVYESHKKLMCSDAIKALSIQLSKNFRSHADVLQFVARVFEQKQVFGEGFMPLQAHDSRVSCFKGKGPRIYLTLALKPGKRDSSVSAEQVKQACARSIAQRFAQFRDEGHEPGQMVILLGRMRWAEVYAQALREANFECAVTGGSLFGRAPEVKVVQRLAQLIANPANTAALFEVLTSPVAGLGADDLLLLATKKEDESARILRRDLDKGFEQAACGKAGPLSDSLARAIRLIRGAQQRARICPLSEVIQDLLIQSGWFATLQTQGVRGLAVAGNLLKAIRLIQRLEETQGVHGAASTAVAFTRELDAQIKEAPGTLSGGTGNAVRIMTIHASKGLEFPLVALADFADITTRSQKFVLHQDENRVRISLMPARFCESFSQISKRGKDSSRNEEEHYTEPLSQDAFRGDLLSRGAAEEVAEARRKLYVGLTRASEALVLAMDAAQPSSRKPLAYPQLIDDIRCALCGEADFPEGEAPLHYGGSQPAMFERVSVQPIQSDHPFSNKDDRPYSLVVNLKDEQVLLKGYKPAREQVFSYTAIAPHNQKSSLCQPEKNGAPIPLNASEKALSVLKNSEEELRRSFDEDKATQLGSAFHRIAQYEVEQQKVPSLQYLEATAQVFGLSDAQFERLKIACDRWFSSKEYAGTKNWTLRRAEVPFFIPVGKQYMEGEIDLLCANDLKPQHEALILDYKTGGKEEETANGLYEKHLLQAQCYAYATLREGWSAVSLHFVRVEQSKKSSQEPQVVCYRFTRDDLKTLYAHIIEKRGAALVLDSASSNTI